MLRLVILAPKKYIIVFFLYDINLKISLLLSLVKLISMQILVNNNQSHKSATPAITNDMFFIFHMFFYLSEDFRERSVCLGYFRGNL